MRPPDRQTSLPFIWKLRAAAIRCTRLPNTRPPGDGPLSPGRHEGLAHAKMASA